jgi:hypothetical protein
MKYLILVTTTELISMGSGAVVLYKNKKAVLTAAHVCKQNSFERFY